MDNDHVLLAIRRNTDDEDILPGLEKDVGVLIEGEGEGLQGAVDWPSLHFLFAVHHRGNHYGLTIGVVAGEDESLVGSRSHAPGFLVEVIGAEFAVAHDRVAEIAARGIDDVGVSEGHPLLILVEVDRVDHLSYGEVEHFGLRVVVRQ